MSERGLSADLTSVAGLRGNPGPPPAMSVVLHVLQIRTVVKKSVLYCNIADSTIQLLTFAIKSPTSLSLQRISAQLPLIGFKLANWKKTKSGAMVKTSSHLAYK